MLEWVTALPWAPVVIACLTLGLAPFTPPHLFEKLRMLRQGTLKKPMDWFDLAFHSAPWVLLVLKGVLGAIP